MTTMTKQNYELVAKVFAEIDDAVTGDVDTATYIIDTIMMRLADEFHAANPRFDRIKFIEACNYAIEE